MFELNFFDFLNTSVLYFYINGDHIFNTITKFCSKTVKITFKMLYLKKNIICVIIFHRSTILSTRRLYYLTIITQSFALWDNLIINSFYKHIHIYEIENLLVQTFTS